MTHFKNGFWGWIYVLQTAKNTLKGCNVNLTVSLKCLLWYNKHYILSYFSFTFFLLPFLVLLILDVTYRLQNVSVTVGLTESTVSTVCGCFGGPGTMSQLVIIIDCPTFPQGRFVKISKTTEYLTLCEVDVFGVAV